MAPATDLGFESAETFSNAMAHSPYDSCIVGYIPGVILGQLDVAQRCRTFKWFKHFALYSYIFNKTVRLPASYNA